MTDKSQSTCDIVDLIHDGRGVGRPQGKTCFIQGALPGEKVAFRRHKQKRNYDEAHVVEILSPSENRIEPRCKHFPRCGGCTLQHFDHRAQVALKEKQLLDSLQRSGMAPQTLLPPLTASPWAYRRRARLALQRAKDGNVLVGFHNPGTRRIEPITECHVLTQPLAEIVASLPRWLTGFPSGIRLFEVELLNADNGIAIGIEASRRPSSEELDAMLVAMDFIDAQLWWKASNQSQFSRLDSGGEPLMLTLADSIQQQVIPGQFIQVNGEINRQMIDQVLSLVRKNPGDKAGNGKTSLAVDLFCGSGNFSLPLAKHFDRVIGVEGLEELVRSAEENARRNNLTNIEFMVSDLSDWKAMDRIKQKIDTLLLDPPRNGAAGVMPWIVKRRPARIVYVSCHPSTMIRDAKTLLEGGYKLTAAGVMDMFPHTAHVEAVALFEK